MLPTTELPQSLAHSREIAYRYRVLPTQGLERVSAQLEAVTGYTDEEALADPAAALGVVPADDGSFAGKPVLVETTAKDGSKVWLEHMVSPVREDGLLVAIEGIARDVSDRVAAERKLAEATARLRGVLDATLSLNAELSLDSLLASIAERAAALTGARYAALGVFDAAGRELERFVTHGIDDETRALLGELPRGRGVLGILIRDAKPLRLRDLGEDPRSVGFPPGHPPMRSFLGVPILVRGVPYGSLYLTEKEGGAEFDEDDEELVGLLAAQAAVAIENARLYDTATLWLRQHEALLEIGNAMARQLERGPLPAMIARELRVLLGARLVTVALVDGIEFVIEAADGDEAEALLGIRARAESTKRGRVLERRRSERVDSTLDDPELSRELSRRMSDHTRAALFVPLVVDDRGLGVLVVHDRLGPDPRFTQNDLRLAEGFATRAAVAADVSDRVHRDIVRSMLEAQELERTRLARELHDETGQALTSILLGLSAVERAGSVEDARRAASDVRALARNALDDVRRLAVELRPAVLDDFGLAAAVERLAESVSEQTGLAIALKVDGANALPSSVESALYRIAQEALVNVVKHACARTVTIVLRRDAEELVLEVADDGRGFDPARVDGARLGLVGIRERVAMLGGKLTIDSSPGAGSRLFCRLPARALD